MRDLGRGQQMLDLSDRRIFSFQLVIDTNILMWDIDPARICGLLFNRAFGVDSRNVGWIRRMVTPQPKDHADENKS